MAAGGLAPADLVSPAALTLRGVAAQYPTRVAGSGPPRSAVMPDPDGTGPGDPPLRTVEQVMDLLEHGANLLVDRNGSVHVLDEGISHEA